MTTHRRLQTFARKYGEDTLALAYHAALPVALTPELLHLIRLNFLPQLAYTAEATLLLQLCQEIGAGLYEIESAMRAELLQGLAEKHGASRLREVAVLLWQYSEQAHSWANYERLERAQQLTALSMFEPDKARNWLAQAETLPSASDQRAWFIAMREELSSNVVNTNPTPKRNFIDSLLACPSMQDRTSRDWIVKELSFYAQIKRHTDYFFDVENIVNACMEHPNGLNRLIETLQLFEADSLPMQAVLQVYNELVSQQSSLNDSKLDQLQKEITHLDELIAQIGKKISFLRNRSAILRGEENYLGVKGLIKEEEKKITNYRARKKQLQEQYNLEQLKVTHSGINNQYEKLLNWLNKLNDNEFRNMIRTLLTVEEQNTFVSVTRIDFLGGMQAWERLDEVEHYLCRKYPNRFNC